MNWQIFPIRIFENHETMQTIKLKRVYDKPLKTDGYRILIDRLWPRGLTKEEAAVDEWAKQIAPSAMLRNWFDHDPYYWEEFQKKYKAELKHNTAMEDFVRRHKDRKHITLVYATKYDKLTHAIILRKFLESKYGEG